MNFRGRTRGKRGNRKTGKLPTLIKGKVPLWPVSSSTTEVEQM
jgi:hypothetical protein